MRVGVLANLLLLAIFYLLMLLPVKAQNIQNEEVSISFRSVSLINALQQLEKQTGFHIYYRKDDLSIYNNASLSIKRRTIQQTLNDLLINTPFTFRQMDYNIFIERATTIGREISGVILSKATLKPIAYTYAEIRRISDSLLLGQSYTDSLGRFLISVKDTSQLTLKLSSMNYKAFSTKVHSGTENIYLDKIFLEPSTTILKEVTITSSAPVIQRESDRFIFNIGNTSLSANNNVWDVLGHAPLVNARDGGAISIIGKQSAMIYINGRKSNLSGEALYNYLKSLPSNNLHKIEVITSPGSEYDASGNAGIINIVFKKRETDGFLGTFSFSNVQATYNTIRTNGSLNYRKGNVGINTVIYANQIKQFITESSKIDFLNLGKSGLLNPINAERPETKGFYGVNVGLDYSINKFQMLTASLDYNYNNQNLQNWTTSNFIDNSSSKLDSSFYSTNYRKVQGHTLDIGLNYRIQLDSLGQSLNFSGDFFNYYSNSNQYLLSKLLETDLIRQDEYSRLPQQINNYTLSIDYNYLFSKTAQLKAGIRSFNTQTQNDLTYIVNNGQGIYLPDTLRSNYYKYEEHINAIYGSLSTKWGNTFSTTLGLRLEQSKTNGKELFHQNVKVDRDYLNLFPNISIGYTPNKDNQFSYTLTNRVNRPSFGEINTNRVYYNPTRYTEGNPFLQPSYILKNEVTYTLKSKYIFIINYNHTRDAYSQFILTNDSSNVVRFTQLNYGKVNEVNIAFVANLFLGKIANTSITAVTTYDSYKGKIDNNQIIDNNGYSGTFKLNNTIYISKTKKWTGYLDFNYNTSQVLSLGTEGKSKPTSSLDIGVRKVISQFTLTLYGTDLLKTSVNNYLFNNAYTTNYFKTYYDNRGIEINVRYNFGNNKLKRNQRRENTNREIINRSGN